MNVYESLSHTKREYKYHVVFIPKYRRQVLYRQLRHHLGQVFRELAHQRECEIEEGHLMVNPVHLAGADSAEVFGLAGDGVYQVQECDPHSVNMARPTRNFVGQHFWARGYWVSTVGRNEAVVRKYIQEQQKEDHRLNLLGLFEGEGRLERLRD